MQKIASMLQLRFKKCLIASLLLFGFALFFVDQSAAQEQEKKPQRSTTRWRWKGPEIGSEIKDFERMLDEYYQARNWDISSGKPLPKKLKELDLAHD